MNWIKKLNKTAAVVTILIAAFVIYVVTAFDFQLKQQGGTPYVPPEVFIDPDSTFAMPDETTFKQVAENDKLILRMDEKTGHFTVEDKRNGNIYRSFPNPEHFEKEKISKIWKQHLTSPLMLQYANFKHNIITPKETNMFAENGSIRDLELVPNGYKLVYEFPNTKFTIPVQVTIQDDYVETKIIREGLKEEGIGLIWARLFPFFGADYTTGQDGYLFIPDGTGAVINFKSSNLNINKVYNESVYGVDLSFAGMNNNRNQIVMPVFGMKNGSHGFLAIIEDGEEYANVYASPAGVNSNYNWITGQMNFRSTYQKYAIYRGQTTNTEYTIDVYNENELFGSDRATRYYLLEPEKANYVGMAETYRNYLMNEKDVEPLKVDNPNLPMNVSIIGADQERGIISSRYLNLTTTEEAASIVEALHEKGIQNMSVNFSGWQKGGYSAFGETFPVDSRLGGDSGLRSFIERVKQLGHSVYLDTEYGLNLTGGGGFNEKFHAMVAPNGRYIDYRLRFSNANVSVVSNRFVDELVAKDLSNYAKMGVDGIVVNSTGRDLYSDYNSNYGLPRYEAKDMQVQTLKQIKETLGAVQGNGSNFYALPYINHIQNMVYDYSYDLFTDYSVPFAQIATHGLVTYSSEYANNRQENANDFLRDIEFGAIPSYVFTRAEAREYVNAYGIRYYNTLYTDWLDVAAAEYKRYNEALGDVQDQFIVGHRTLAPNVKETTYANGKRIIVNYNLTPYSAGQIEVPAQDFVVVQGGESR